jgi:DNA-binding transcriptional regulator GbsR (MarR family)
MKGYLWTPGAGESRPRPEATGAPGGAAAWEALAVDAVGNVIEFWGFKRNQGRVWCLLYLRGEPLAAGDIESILDLSKGGVSMTLRDLERWGVVQRVRGPGDTAWHYRAETDMVRMVTHVIEEREATFVSRVRTDLAEAHRLATGTQGVGKETMGRLERMLTLAEHTERALRLFIKTARLDVGGLLNAFREEASGPRRPGR